MNKETRKLLEEWNGFFGFASAVILVFAIMGIIVFVIAELIMGGLWFIAVIFLFWVCFCGFIITNKLLK